MTRLIKLALFLVLIAPFLKAQSFYSFPPFNKYPGAGFFVCGVPAAGNPCTNQVTVYADQGLLSPIKQPATIGADGNYGFWIPAATAQITIQVGDPYKVSYIVSVGGGGGGGGLTVNANNFTGTDWCAQVNAADTSVVGASAIISVPSAMSGLTACTTSITLHANHQLQFGSGTFALGSQSARAGIVIAPSANNVSIIGAGIGQTILTYTSVNNGAGNGFLNGSAIGMGTVTACTSNASVSNNILISGLSIVDLNTGSALGSGSNPSGISGACVNHVIIENNELTDIKGNGGITVLGNWNGFGGDTYYDRNNIFDGTVAGGGGEFTADNSTNWTHYYVLNNTVSRWPCAFGVSRAVEGLIQGNTVDATLKGPFSACPQIGLGAGSDTSGTLGNLFAINNIVVMGFSGVGIGIFPASTIDNTLQIGIIGNNILTGAGSSETGISINGVGVGHIAPALIVQNNTVATDFGTTVTGLLKSVEFSGNTFTAINGGVPLFSCSGTPTIASGGLVRVFNNRASGPLTGGVAKACTDASFSTRQFQEWGNTLNDGNLNSSAIASGFLGQATVLTWTPGTIAANAASSDQVVTVTQAIAGDSVTIVNANGSSNWLSLPSGVIASGYVSAANTVTFNIVNTTAAAVTINSGSAIQSYAIVDRPPNNAQSLAFKSIAGNGTVTNTGGALTANAVVLGAGGNDTKVSTGITTNGASELDLGVSGTSGVFGLNGSTSGKATLTAPAVAGTSTNAVAMSNVLQGPSGSNTHPTYQVNATDATGIYSAGAQSFDVTVNGTNTFTCVSGFCQDRIDFVAGTNIYISTHSRLLISATAPTIAAGGCGGAAASIPSNNGTAAFTVNVGTTPGSACTFTLPAAVNDWICHASDLTTANTSVFLQKQTGAASTTGATITNFNTAGAATAFVASDVLRVSCFAD